MTMIQSQLELQELQNIKIYPFSAQRIFVAAVRAVEQTVRFFPSHTMTMAWPA